MAHNPTAVPHPVPGAIVVLLVEDDMDLRDMTSAYLREVGYKVLATQSAQEALTAINAGIHIDLVFSDINMPGSMHRMGFAHWLSVNHPLVPVLLTSGATRPEVNPTTQHRRFVQKPYEFDTLEQDIRSLL